MLSPASGGSSAGGAGSLRPRGWRKWGGTLWQPLGRAGREPLVGLPWEGRAGFIPAAWPAQSKEGLQRVCGGSGAHGPPPGLRAAPGDSAALQDPGRVPTRPVGPAAKRKVAALAALRRCRRRQFRTREWRVVLPCGTRASLPSALGTCDDLTAVSLGAEAWTCCSRGHRRCPFMFSHCGRSAQDPGAPGGRHALGALPPWLSCRQRTGCVLVPRAGWPSCWGSRPFPTVLSAWVWGSPSMSWTCPGL